MKTYILVGLILVCAIVAQVQGASVDMFKQMLNAAIKECQAEVKADSADVENLRQHRPITSASGKCFIACLNKKFKIQDASGALDGYATREILKSLDSLEKDVYDALNNIGDICVVEVEEKIEDDTPDGCDIASKWHDCIVRESVKVNLPLWLAEI